MGLIAENSIIKKEGLRFVRELEGRDLERLKEDGRAPENANPDKIRSKHHALARALAGGMSDQEAAFASGYSPSRVSVLKGSQNIKHLIEVYRMEANRDYAALAERLVGVSHDALEELSDRLEDEPESFTNAELRNLVQLGADRSGFGPSTTHEVNVNEGMGERLVLARARATERRALRDASKISDAIFEDIDKELEA